MKQFIAIFLILALSLTGCAANTLSAETTAPTQMQSVILTEDAVQEQTIPENPTEPAETAPEITVSPEIPEETAPEETDSEPTEEPIPTVAETVETPAPTEPKATEPKPTEPKPTEPKPTEPVVSAPTEAPKPTTGNRPVSYATCKDTGSDKIWEDPAANQKDYYEETDPERTAYLEYLRKSGNNYFYYMQEESMRMYLGKTYGMPLYTSEEMLLATQWSSSDPSVATVNQVGFVVPLKEGNTVITLVYDGPEADRILIWDIPVRVEHEPVYTFAQLEQQAKNEAKEIAEYIRSLNLNNDLEVIAAAATVINTYVGKGTSTSYVAGYNQPFGTLVTGYSSCAGSTRALGLVLEYLGFQWYHTNENQWDHQWCVVYDVDGQTAFADGSMYGIAGYGERMEDGSNWMQYKYGQLKPLF